MRKSLIYFSYLIIVSNFLFFVVGISANIGFVGAFMGGLMAIGTDPIIIMMGIIIGTALVVQQSSFSVIYLWLAAMFSTILIHVVLGTTKVFVDVVRFDALLIIPALIIIVTSFFSPKSKPTKKTKAIKLPTIKLPKRLWIAVPIIGVISLIFYGVTNYESKVAEDDPRWMVCEPNRNFWNKPKPLYIKFHNTEYITYDWENQEWVNIGYSGDFLDKWRATEGEVMPTIEMHEDKTRFTHIIFGYKKILPVYVSDKYYVFYKEINDGWFWGGEIKTSGQHIILTRSDLTLLEYNNQWIRSLGMRKKFNDSVIDKMFKEVNEWPENLSFNIMRENYTEEVVTGSNRTFKGKRSLYTFQCEEIAAIKPKI
tara:strand:+ start:94 stop:1197 length:1104 start_codon:yes stop_codon:yes gene_type:complete